MRKIKRRMAVLLLVMVMLISGGCQNMHHLSANQTGTKDRVLVMGHKIADPDSFSSAAVTAKKAMTGIMALRRACFFRASTRVRPRLKAVRM